MSEPAISVLMTIYNGGRFLGPAVEGLLAQTFGDFELIAIENGSVDGSLEVMRAFAVHDSRVKLVELDKNIGRTPALILALSMARGEFVAVQDADDVSLLNRFEYQIAYLQAHQTCQLLGTWCRIIDESDAQVGIFHPAGDAETAFQTMAYSNVVAHSAAMYRRHSALTVGGYPVDLPFSQDYGLWVRLMTLGGVAVLEEELAAIRQHGDNLSVSPATAIARSRDAIRSFRRVHGLPGLLPAARRGNRRVRALESGRLAQALLAGGRWWDGLGWGLYGILCDPVAFIGKIVGKTI